MPSTLTTIAAVAATTVAATASAAVGLVATPCRSYAPGGKTFTYIDCDTGLPL